MKHESNVEDLSEGHLIRAPVSNVVAPENAVCYIYGLPRDFNYFSFPDLRLVKHAILALMIRTQTA